MHGYPNIKKSIGILGSFVHLELIVSFLVLCYRRTIVVLMDTYSWLLINPNEHNFSPENEN